MKPKLTWLLAPICLAALLATWGGWAKLASMTGYAEVEMLPGIAMSKFNIGIVLPMSVEPFGALSMSVAFNSKVRPWARVIAGIMAVTTLVAAGVCQAVVHHLTVSGATQAPDIVVAIASVLPVIVIGLGAGLSMLNAARISDNELTQTSTRPSFLGRIGTALGDAAATRAERFAETTRAAPPSTQTAAQTRPAERPGTTQGTVPDVPTQATQTAAEPSRIYVPAARPLQVAAKVDKEVQRRQVTQLRQAIHPETNRPWSYAQIAVELGISKSEAQRLGTATEEPVPGTVDPTRPDAGTIQETTGGPSVNGHDVARELRSVAG